MEQHNKIMKKIRRVVLFLFIGTVFLLSACSSMSGSQSVKKSVSQEGQKALSEDGYGSASQSSKEFTENDTADEAPSSTEAQNQSIEAEKKDQKLVYTCDMTIETLEYAQTIKAIKKQIAKYHGILEQENESDHNYEWYYAKEKTIGSLSSFLVIRIPAENYDKFLEELSGNGKVTSKNMRVDNITKQYSELETTIKSLKTQEERLLTMMEQAKTVEDMITVESRLSEVQNELEQYKNTLAGLDTDITYSTINLSVNEVVKYEQSTKTFKERLTNTFEESKELFLDFLENSLFFLILFGPILLFIGLILFVIISVIRRIRRNKRQKKIIKRFHNQISQEEATDSKNHVIKAETLEENNKNDNISSDH